MARRENWFKHDIDSQLVPAMRLYIQKTGAAGYGYFWTVVEEMHRTSKPEQTRANAILLGQMLGLEFCIISDFIAAAIECGLWEQKGDLLVSKRAQREITGRVEKQNDISEKRRSAALESAKVRKQKLANASKAEQTPAKRLDKRRGDKSRLDINITPPPILEQKPEENPKPKKPIPIFDPSNKTKFEDHVYLSDGQIERVQNYYKSKGLGPDDLREAIRELDRWFADNPKMRAKRSDDAKALMGWPLDNAIKRKQNLLSLERQKQYAR